jgi:predicted ATPase
MRDADPHARTLADVPFVQRLTVAASRVNDWGAFPTNLPFLRELDYRFTSRVTFFVGENGSGKSTLLEAIAEACDLPVGGGGRSDVGAGHAPQRESDLAPFVRVGFLKRPRAGWFFRAEFLAHFASLLDEREADPSFGRDPYERYGGAPLHRRSHGEAFLDVAAGVLDGVVLMDEPEAALSPKRQLSLLAMIYDAVTTSPTQLIIATHSPILLTFPGARIVSFDGDTLTEIDRTETAHHEVTAGILADPERYWRHLRGG